MPLPGTPHSNTGVPFFSTRFEPFGAVLSGQCLLTASEPLRLLLEATCTPYDLHIHFFGESANPADYQSRAGPLAELPLYKGDELGDASICGCKAILRHLGRTLEGSLCGEEDDLPAQAEVDQLLELSFDMLDAMQGFRGGSTSSKDGEFVKPGWWSL